MTPWVIRVAARCRGAERWAVLLHELAHVAVHLSGLALSHEREEVLARAVELVLVPALGQSLTGTSLGRDLLALSDLAARPAIIACDCDAPIRQHRLSDGAWRCARCTLPLPAEEVPHAG